MSSKKIEYLKSKQKEEMLYISPMENKQIELEYNGKPTLFNVVCQFFVNLDFLQGVYLAIEFEEELLLLKWDYEKELLTYITDDKEWFYAKKTLDSIISKATENEDKWNKDMGIE